MLAQGSYFVATNDLAFVVQVSTTLDTPTVSFDGVIPLALLSGLPFGRIVRVALVPHFIMRGLPLALLGQNGMVAISSTFYVRVAFCRIFLMGGISSTTTIRWFLLVIYGNF